MHESFANYFHSWIGLKNHAMISDVETDVSKRQGKRKQCLEFEADVVLRKLSEFLYILRIARSKTRFKNEQRRRCDDDSFANNIFPPYEVFVLYVLKEN